MDIVALLTAPVSSTPAPTKLILTEKEIKQQRTNEKLQKLMSKSAHLFNTRDLKDVVERMQEIRNNKKNTEVDVGGQKFEKYKKNYVDDEIDTEDRAEIKKRLNEYKYELSDEDDEDGRYDLDAKFRAEVGASGKFNRPQPVMAISTRTRNDEEDEYDDTYDDVPIAVDQRSRVPEERHKGSEDQKEGHQGSGPMEGYAENYVRRENKKNKYAPILDGRTGKVVDVGRVLSKNQADQQKAHAAKQQQEKPYPRVFKPNPKPGTSSSKAGAPNAPRGSQPPPKPTQQQQPQAAPGPSKFNPGPPSQPSGSTRTDGYTGGKQRLNKERNKNKFKQRGADKKMARANPL